MTPLANDDALKQAISQVETGNLLVLHDSQALRDALLDRIGDDPDEDDSNGMSP